jgi:hypothetical protein
MTSDSASAKANTAVVMSDACLFTAATFCLLAVIAGPLALIIGPAAAWLLHGRRLDRTSVVCGSIGLALSLLVVGGFFVLVPLILGGLGLMDEADFTVPVVLLGTAGAAFLALVVALDIDSIRDLTPARRQHTRLDIARLVSTVVVTLFGAVVGVAQTVYPASEIGDAGVFAIGAAAVGGVTMLAAKTVHARWEKRTSP